MTRIRTLLSALLIASVALLGTQLHVRAQVADEGMMAQDGMELPPEEGADAAMTDEGMTDDPTLLTDGEAVPPTEWPTAQEPDAVVLKAGEILEILPLHSVAQPAYAWILTQERRFIQADRSRFFRVRLTEPGTYTLTAEVTGGVNAARVRSVFTIVIEPRIPGAPGSSASAQPRLVETLPPLSEDSTAVLPRQEQALLLLPTGNRRPLNIDADTSVDTDGNGNPQDDVDNAGTLFQTDATPLLLWFLDPVTERVMTVSAQNPDGTLRTQDIAVVGFDVARDSGLLQSAVSIQSASADGRTVQFSAVFAPNTKPDAPLLYRWDFGDGVQSLETQPTHTFDTGSGFTVSLQVRNLLTGQDIGSATKTMTMTEGAAASSAASQQASLAASTSSSAASEGTNAGKTGGIARLRVLLPLVGAFVGAVIVGMVLVAILSVLRRRKSGGAQAGMLQKHFQDMEAKLMKKQETAAATPKTPPEAIAEREVERDAARPSPPPTVRAESAPSWLKQGLQGKSVAPATPAPSAPAPPKPAVPPAPAAGKPAAPVMPAPKPVPPPAPAPAKQAAVPPPPTPKPQVPSPRPTPPVPPKPAPPQQPPPAAASAQPSPSSAPAPVQPAPKPAPAPVPPPAPQPKAPAPAPVLDTAPQTPAPLPPATPPAPVNTANAPSWLKQGLQGKPDLGAPPAPAAPVQSATPAEDPTIAVITVENLGQKDTGEQKAG